ncbi:MAG: alpha-L-rhamnosidase, partial [Cytophagales bacterium]|nr:alpha-L-rhamnosidase [Armatimonadota bacterium]
MLQPTKILLETPPYRSLDESRSWLTRGTWPAWWVGCPDGKTPLVAAYRCRFRVDSPAAVRVHVTADERYELFLDGSRIGSGPERGDPANWFFDTYDLPLAPGDHTLTARVWALGQAAPRALMSVAPGFLLSPDADALRERLATGIAAWEVKRLEGYTFTRPFDHDFFSIGYNTTIDGSRFGWRFEHGDGDGWEPVTILHAGSDAEQRTRIGASVHRLRSATLPALLYREWTGGQVRFISDATFDNAPIPVDDSLFGEVSQWQTFWQGDDSVTLPPHAERRVLIDLETYLTAHVALKVTGGRGGRVRVHWAESLFDTPDARTKGNRNRIDGKYFIGIGDTFLPDGGPNRIFETLLWRAGRFLELRVKSEDEPLTLHRLALWETRYPLEQESVFESDDARLAPLFPLAVRTLQASCHDAYIDGPFYEQMMWAGDGVQNILTTFTLTHDDRPARRWLSLLDASRDASGLTCARWPARDRLTIAPYSLYWVQMVGQFALWRDDPTFVRSLLPGVRSVLDALERLRNDDGILSAPPGWNFVDWVPGWRDGIPPGGDRGVSAVLNGHLAWTLMQCANLEAAHGEPELAQLYQRRAREITERITDAFWCEERGLFADDLGHTSFSEHAQCFAVLGGLLPPEKRSRIGEALLNDASLTRATISFTHYLFETFRVLGRVDALFDRLGLWFGLEAQGFRTLPEGPDPARSDCHAWGTHPLFHAFATIAGIRPAAPGFAAVQITPQMGPMSRLDVTLPHPRGEIRLSLRRGGPDG